MLTSDAKRMAVSVAGAIAGGYETRLRKGIENSSVFRLSLTPKERSYAAGKRGIGGYDYRDHDSIEAMNAALAELVGDAAGRVAYLDDGRRPRLLRVDDGIVDRAYELLDRKRPVPDSSLRAKSLLDSVAGAGGWQAKWAGLESERIGSGGVDYARWGFVLEKLEDLCAALIATAELPLPTSKRILSEKAFGDSKKFEREVEANYRKAVTDVGGDPDRIFIGTARRVTFSGNGPTIHMAGGVSIPLSVFDAVGLSVGTAAVDRIVSVDGVDAILIVENKTNFEVISAERIEGLVVIYGNGNDFEPAALLAQRLSEQVPKRVPILAWSDIDYGGFGIVEGIMGICERAVPFLMGVEELEAVDFDLLLEHSGKEEYFEKISKYLDSRIDSPFRAAGEWCISHQRTLEQESLLFGYAQQRIMRLLQQFKG